MGRGKLKIEVFTGSQSLPVNKADIKIKGSGGRILYELATNENGIAETVELDAPAKSNSLDPYNPGPFYLSYDVEINAKGYDTTIIRGVQIFDEEVSLLPVNLIPMSAEPTRTIYVNEVNIPAPAVEMNVTRQQESFLPKGKILQDVIIPDKVIVHLGRPNSAAENVTVPFQYYIKNVASSEIYPTWPQNALVANIYCHISLILNRIYTEWYPSKGYSFNITNSTAYDQAFVFGRNIFENISNIVDEIFNYYVRRQGRKEPYFTEYCNGTTSTCPGLSQWGTVTLAEKGMRPLEILKYYYPDDIELVECKKISSVYESYPGTPLREGSSGANVQRMQNYLNRIRVNYPLIPEIKNPNGFFGSDTTTAVKVFQETFSLIADGIIGKGTWYKISSIYTAIKKLSELGSEGEYIDVGLNPPSTVVKEGSKGSDVVQLQFLLNYISQFYPGVLPVIENGYFDRTTHNSVVTFQSLFGLKPDGIVGATTWRKLFEIYYGIRENVAVPPDTSGTTPEYPGTSLKVGSTGPAVLQIQKCLNNISKTYPSIPKLTEDGKFGSGTQSAVIAFQKIFGLTQDGIVGPTSWKKIMEECKKTGVPERPLYPGTSLRVGSRGDNVLIMQKYLNKISDFYAAIPKLKADGVFGSGTEAAVKAYQRLFGLTADGIIGPATWNSIVDKYIALSKSTFEVQSVAETNTAAQAMGLILMKNLVSRNFYNF